jgi:uncharacterized protein YkwD
MTPGKSGAKLDRVPGKKQVSMFFALGLLAFLAVVPAAQAAPAASTQASLLRAVNEARAAYGLRPVRLDVRLGRAARSHTRDMLLKNVFSHGDFHGRMVAFEVRGRVAGENLAWGSGSYAEAKTIVAEWLASPGHRANLLRAAYTRIGIGLAAGTFLGNGGATVVTADFAG